MMRTLQRRVCLLALTLMMVMAMVCPALATDSATPVPVYPPAGYTYASTDYIMRLYAEDSERKDDLVRLRTILSECGFYDAELNTEAMYIDYLNDDDMIAVEKLCRMNSFTHDRYGVLLETWWRIDEAYRNGTLVRPAAEQAPVGGQAAASYTFIPYGTKGSDVISKIQALLSGWGFLRETYNPGDYEESTANALSACFALNNINDTQRELNGLSETLQKHLLENSGSFITPEPTPDPGEVTPEPTAKKSAVERARSYLTNSTSIAGLAIPNLVLWIIGMLLVVLIVLAVIHFFGPGVKVNPAHRRGRGNVLTFEISYGGKSEIFNCVITKVLRIGRGVGVFPLNLDDTSISRKHCEIYYSNGQLMLRDYSTYGTQINGQLVQSTERRLNSGDVIQIGDHVIVLTMDQKGR